MKKITIYHYDAFSHIPNRGNPAGIVITTANLSETEMQNIATYVRYSETAFFLPSKVADFKIRYFTPGHEVDLCGHATIAMVYALYSKKIIDHKKEVLIETKAGVLPIKIQRNRIGQLQVTMHQRPPEFKPFRGSIKSLARSLDITNDDIDSSLPIVYGSTGTWTLLVPIKRLEVFKRMNPKNTHFPFILQDMPKVSIHPFCLETYSHDCNMHARHFSSPYSGTKEDPVTGTASGVMGAYYLTYIHPEKSKKLVIEQGQEMGKRGEVVVQIQYEDEKPIVTITGTAVYVNKVETDQEEIDQGLIQGKIQKQN
ncbi:PhzF family phenazine biosynthesis isomerase [Terrilactibacillus laevilacticus]|uniref:PhzF family phenazine biosynthesis isomerase n=1 Tax=Terrilactibacillus laevilacticus TaxID=1380157 RepID=UPI001146DB4D|nr:PhzF family phenazine biosynthesis isomerase [Terrilactibacillus laevilacticus]